jgi:hypothetical protein
MIVQNPRPTSLGDLNDRDVLPAERLGEHGRGAGHAGQRFAEALDQPLGVRQPVVEETGGTGQEARGASSFSTIKSLFNRDLGHGLSVIRECNKPSRNDLQSTFVPEGLAENGPAIHRWGGCARHSSF